MKKYLISKINMNKEHKNPLRTKNKESSRKKEHSRRKKKKRLNFY
jgi:hypothetical protein